MDKDLLEKHINIIIGTIGIQKVMISGKEYLPDSKFNYGYIYGFVDYFFQNHKNWSQDNDAWDLANIKIFRYFFGK